MPLSLSVSWLLAFLSFTLQYTERRLPRPRITLTLLAMPLVALIVLAYTDPLHGLIRHTNDSGGETSCVRVLFNRSCEQMIALELRRHLQGRQSLSFELCNDVCHDNIETARIRQLGGEGTVQRET